MRPLLPHSLSVMLAVPGRIQAVHQVLWHVSNTCPRQLGKSSSTATGHLLSTFPFLLDLRPQCQTLHPPIFEEVLRPSIQLDDVEGRFLSCSLSLQLGRAAFLPTQLEVDLHRDQCSGSCRDRNPSSCQLRATPFHLHQLASMPFGE